MLDCHVEQSETSRQMLTLHCLPFSMTLRFLDFCKRSNDTRLVWIIHPDEKYVLVYHSPEPDRFLRPQDTLDGEAIIPGFSMSVAELFEEWDF